MKQFRFIQRMLQIISLLGILTFTYPPTAFAGAEGAEFSRIVIEAIELSPKEKWLLHKDSSAKFNIKIIGRVRILDPVDRSLDKSQVTDYMHRYLELNSLSGKLNFDFSTCKFQSSPIDPDLFEKSITFDSRADCLVTAEQIYGSSNTLETDIWVADSNLSITSNSVSAKLKHEPDLGPWYLSSYFFAFLTFIFGLLLTGIVEMLRRSSRQKSETEKKQSVDPSDVLEREKNISSPDDVENYNSLNRAVLQDVEIPQGLVASIKARNCILMLGSGASAQAGYPSGIELLKQIVKRFDSELPAHIHSHIQSLVDRPSSPQSTTDFSVAMESILGFVDRHDLEAEIENILDAVKPNSSFHKSLDQINWRGVVSLVWDNIAEKTMRRNQGPIFTIDDGKKIQEITRNDDNFFIKALGSFEHSRSLTWYIEDFRQNVTNAPEFKRQFLSLAQRNSLLFVGVGIQTLKTFFDALDYHGEKSNIKHWAIVPDSKENMLFGSVLKRYGVILIEYSDLHNHSQLRDIINELQEKTADRAFDGILNERKINKSSQQSTLRVTKLILENIGPFPSLTLDFQNNSNQDTSSQDANDGAAWTVLMGQNGSGKTIVMRALSLALCASDKRSQSAGRNLLSFGKDQGKIEVLLQSEEGLESSLITALQRNYGEVEVESRTISPLETGHLLVLGFPALRGAPSNDPVGPASYTPSRVGPQDLRPLLENTIDYRMDDFKQWIVNILSQSKKDKKSRQIRSLLDQIIIDLVPGDFLGFADIEADFKIRLKRKTFDDLGSSKYDYIEFGSVSQGMSSIFNWLGVLIQRLHYYYGSDDNPKLQKAIVLIDEMDAHLHPEWQRKLVSLTKKHFPNVQMIVSTHSVLMAGAVKREEIRMIDRDPFDGVYSVRKPGRQTYGLKSSDLFVEVFEMKTDRNPKTEEMIIEFEGLSQTRTSDQEERYVELQEKLQDLDYAGALDPDLDNWDLPTNEDLENFTNRKGKGEAQ